MNAFLAAILFFQVFFLLSLWFVYRNLKHSFIRFFTQPDEKTPSGFSLMVDSVAAVFGTRIVQSAEGALRGSMGGTMKGENAAARREMIAQNPLLGLFASSKLGKNPLAVGILSMLGEKMAQGQSQVNNNGSHTESPKFKF